MYRLSALLNVYGYCSTDVDSLLVPYVQMPCHSHSFSHPFTYPSFTCRQLCHTTGRSHAALAETMAALH
jgi:hypothetical protein